jgi:hypothetical protein
VWPVAGQMNQQATCPAIRQTPARTTGQAAERIPPWIAAQIPRQIVSWIALPVPSLTATYSILSTVCRVIPQVQGSVRELQA